MINSIKVFLIKQLVYIHAGSGLAKAKSTITLASTLSPFTVIFSKFIDWSIGNSIYLIFTLGAIIVDHFLGTIVHKWIKRDFSWKLNAIGLLTKVGMVVCASFLFEGVEHILDSESIVKDYINILLRMVVFIYPMGSALSNMSIITKGKFPPVGLMKRISIFEKDLDVKKMFNDE